MRGAHAGHPGGFARAADVRTKCAQAIFNILAHKDFGAGFALAGARVCDLFAGTGALGIEALSHGARFALLVDDAAESRALIRINVEVLGLTGLTKIWRRDATDLGPMAAGSGGPFEHAFLDPPYRQNLAAPALAALRDGAVARARRACRGGNPPRTKLFRLRTVSAYRTSAVYGDTRVLVLVSRPDEKKGVMARECGPPSWILYDGEGSRGSFSVNTGEYVTWVARRAGHDSLGGNRPYRFIRNVKRVSSAVDTASSVPPCALAISEAM